MRAPDNIKVTTSWYPMKEDKKLNELKEGDEVLLSFGTKRDRNITYHIDTISPFTVRLKKGEGSKQK